ncbi:DEAD/DEAH box helicase [Candidatus Woesearchaeota archaeon]|nr:DEAD/DEAH box helicase [Candidatus Woesearchaeota archaeon]
MRINFEPRLYQETIFASASQTNSLVVLPTGLGKTNIFLMLAAHRLKLYPESKILLLGPTRPLIDQYKDVFEKCSDIPPEKMAIFTGHVKPEKRAELWKTSQLIFSTPQGLENDIITKRVTLDKVSLLGFDEAHRAVKEYSYVWIAKQYHKQASCERIVGMTASPGSDLETIENVCKNLYVENLEVRTDSDPDVKEYIQDTNIEWIKLDLPEPFLKIKKFLEDCYFSKLEQVKRFGYMYGELSTYNKSTLLALQGGLHGKISQGEHDFNLLKSVSLVAEALKVSHALELVETQGAMALNHYLDKLQQEALSSKVKAIQNLVRDLNFRSATILTQSLIKKGIEHPKLPKIAELIEEELQKNIKILVFSQYRDTGEQIKEFLHKKNINSEVFVGQMKKRGSGLSQKEQKKVLDRFKAGEFSVLIATSVAEEGLDIPEVDAVLFYEPIPSAIRTVQRRGRTGRHREGKVYVLMAKATRDEAYRWSAHYKEKRMNNILKELKKKFLSKQPVQQTLEPFTGAEALSIVADYREKASGTIKELIQMGANIDLKQLAVGDFLLSKDVVVELKRIPDFVDSIIDKRLLNQLKSLTSYTKPVIILEGTEDIYAQRKIHPNAIRGMLATIAVSYKIPIIYSQSPRDTAYLLASIAKREQTDEKKEFTFHTTKPLSLKEQQEFLISALPGIGATLSKPLLQQFNSVKNIITATEEDLKKVELIGELKAKRIKEVVDTQYKDEPIIRKEE